jgi:hypothetical protein
MPIAAVPPSLPVVGEDRCPGRFSNPPEMTIHGPRLRRLDVPSRSPLRPELAQPISLTTSSPRDGSLASTSSPQTIKLPSTAKRLGTWRRIRGALVVVGRLGRRKSPITTPPCRLYQAAKPSVLIGFEASRRSVAGVVGCPPLRHHQDGAYTVRCFGVDDPLIAVATGEGDPAARSQLPGLSSTGQLGSEQIATALGGGQRVGDGRAGHTEVEPSSAFTTVRCSPVSKFKTKRS